LKDNKSNYPGICSGFLPAKAPIRANSSTVHPSAFIRQRQSSGPKSDYGFPHRHHYRYPILFGNIKPDRSLFMRMIVRFTNTANMEKIELFPNDIN
jgi:hypothetical protein